MWDQVKPLGNKELIYFGPLSDSNPDELGQKVSDQDKKSATSFKWTSRTVPNSVGKNGNVENKGSQQECAIDIPTWDAFTNTTTFHGVRYIFSKSSSKLRR